MAKARGARFVKEEIGEDFISYEPATEVDINIAHKALNDVMQWLGFAGYFDYSAALGEEGRAIFERAA